MSLRHGLLGLLAEGPASGYDLTRRFQELLSHIWPAQHPKIYAELNRLSEAGLIEVDSLGPRGRKTYRITEAGRAEVHRWLSEGEVDHTMRLEPVLRSLFFWLLSPEELDRHLARESRYYAETARRFREYAAAKDRGDFGNSPQVQSIRVTVEAGVRLYDALAEWAEWARSSPLTAGRAPGAEPPDGGPSAAPAEPGPAPGDGRPDD
ncbi:helix-turn-helix transcriptional regulator [Marinactinospora rubrisoli]|uniref:Helix-turn-helix transcriptional regulator n=1 Tax=Marinactinospora rubrisoli TaxID=2715399 RepID=A0ABW2KQY4_9ACTN